MCAAIDSEGLEKWADTLDGERNVELQIKLLPRPKLCEIILTSNLTRDEKNSLTFDNIENITIEMNEKNAYILLSLNMEKTDEKSNTTNLTIILNKSDFENIPVGTYTGKIKKIKKTTQFF